VGQGDVEGKVGFVRFGLFLVLGLAALGAIVYFAPGRSPGSLEGVGRFPGPLEGFSNAGEGIYDRGGAPLEAGDVLFTGCQVLMNHTEVDLVVTDVRLELDSSSAPSVTEGPFYKVLGDDDYLTCGGYVPASELPGVSPLPDELVIRPGDHVQILHTLVYNGGDVEKVLGYTVDYRRGVMRHRKFFNMEAWLCSSRSLCSPD
jgi:hypothetical protein